MKKYQVLVERKCYYNIDVNAETEEEAKDYACRQADLMESFKNNKTATVLSAEEVKPKTYCVSVEKTLHYDDVIVKAFSEDEAVDNAFNRVRNNEVFVAHSECDYDIKEVKND